MGNILDRLRQGAVTDFLDFYWKDWHWPTFNMADVAIFTGAMMLLAASLPLRRKTETTHADPLTRSFAALCAAWAIALAATLGAMFIGGFLLLLLLEELMA